MSFKGKVAVAAAALLAGAGGAYAQSQKVTGPVAEYWVSAATSSGFGAGMAGGGRPSMGSMMGMAMGRSGGAQHLLTLQLGSNQSPAGAPQADHLPPPALGAGAALPLVSPEHYTPEPSTPSDPRPPNMQKPEGRMLIYWGCGDTAGPGQPAVIDFAKIGQGQFPHLPNIAVTVAQPPSPERYKTYGEWPNSRSRATVPPTGSLIGAHAVKGNYSPAINFNLGPSQDFLGPLTITEKAPQPSGGTRLSWGAVANATGYSAWLVGADAAQGGKTVVIWTSSRAQAMMGALMDYLPPAEVRRLVAAGAVMSPQTTSCTIPAEVVKAAPMGLLSMIAYGDEANFVDPPRPGAPAPWNISWRVKVRYKSTTGALLGMPGMGAGDDEAAPAQAGGHGAMHGRQGPTPDQAQQQQPQQQQPAMPSVGRAIGGALLRRGLPF